MPHIFKDKFQTTPIDVQPDDCFITKVVAVAGHADDWAAYEGPTTLTDQEVVDKGSKLLEEQAVPLFWIMRVSGRTYRA